MTTQTGIHRTPTGEAIQAYYAAMRLFWHPVLPAAALNEKSLHGVELLEEQIVIARLNGQLIAMQDVCRHFQAKLSVGEVRHVEGHGDCIMCRYHGWTYAANGQCIDIPQLDANRDIPATATVPSYHIAERYGLIWVCLGESPTFDLPTLPYVDDPAFLAGPLRTYEPWTASAPRVIMAALDDTHGPWVHEDVFGGRDNPLPPEHEARREGPYLVVDIKMWQKNNATIAENGDDSAYRPVELTTTVGIPNVIHFDIYASDTKDDRHTIIWQAVCPHRYNLTSTYWGSARNYDLDQPAHDETFEALQDKIRAQDKRVVETQRPWLLPPFWTKIELPIRSADLPLIAYHKWLEELGITIAL